jgi:hypothetical protein
MRSAIALLPVCLGTAACLPHPAEVAHPQPATIVLQVTELAPCNPVHACEERPATVRRGRLVFVDGDSLVMVDVARGVHIAVRPGPDVSVAMYTGQRMTGGAVAKGAAKGALLGGLFSAVAGVAQAGIFNALSDWKVDVGEVAAEAGATGLVVGVIGGAAHGATNGESAWQPVTLLQVRQHLCRCARPDSTGPAPIVASARP